MKKMMISALVASTLAIAGGDIAPVGEEVEGTSAVMEESGWQHNILIYGWFPTISGTLNYDIPGSGGEASVDASDILDALEMVFMGAYETRKDKWSFKADAIYLDLGKSTKNAATVPGGIVKVDAYQSMTAWALGFYGGYNTVQTEKLTLDVMAGARYFSLEAGAELQINGPFSPPLNLDRSVELWDAIVGIKGSYKVSEKWFIPYHFDIGAGDSDLTWQALAGVGYTYGWGDALLVYRHLSYGEGDDGLVKDLDFSGPAIAVNFRF